MKLELIDVVVSQGYDREESLKIIKAGKVFLNNEPILFPHIKINEKDIIKIKSPRKWVSRGAYKLLKALESFDVNTNDKVVIDIGSSTGGFTQVLLKNGAKKVYSIDVGTNQLDFLLRIDKRVISMEKTNLKDLKSQMFNEKIDLIVTDVSFISLSHVFRVSRELLSTNSKIIALIKPQFEAYRDQVSEGGVVDKKFHKEIIDKVKKYAIESDFEFIDLTESPILGNKSKNIEYISIFRKV